MNNNKLKGEDLDILVNRCPNLRKIKIENNFISDIQVLQKLIGLNLKKLNIKGNPFLAKNSNYREELFKIFISLTCIDGKGKEGDNIESTEYGNYENLFEEVNDSGLSQFEESEIEYEENVEIEDSEESEEEDDEESEKKEHTKKEEENA